MLKNETEESKVHLGPVTCHAGFEVTQEQPLQQHFWFQTFCPINPAADGTLRSSPFRINACTAKALCHTVKWVTPAGMEGSTQNGFDHS